MNKASAAKKFFLMSLIAVIAFMIWYFDLSRFISLAFFQNLYSEQPLVTAGVFFAIYVASAAFSIPAAALLTLMGGAIFGLLYGVLLVSFASSIGASLAFLATRFLLKDWVQNTFADYLQKINQGVEKDGGFYLFSLRLIPLFPFWAINLTMALTPIKARTFYWVSQLGMLPATLVYVNAGAQLGGIEELSLKGIFTLELLLAFILLAVFPFFAKWLLNAFKAKKVYQGYKKPKTFDANMVVIGAGSGGLVSAYIAAAVKAKVILIEKHQMGGDCLNTGCVPSKALIKVAKTVHDIQLAKQLGVKVGELEVDFSRVMAKVNEAVSRIAPHDSIERYTELGVQCITGEAKILNPWQVAVGDQVISAQSIVIATGASPFVPPIPGLAEINFLSSDNLWDLKELPNRLLVMGAGPIGCELAQAFNRLGSQVTLVDMMPKVLPKEDNDVSDLISEHLRQEGVELLLEHKVLSFEQIEGGTTVNLQTGEQGVTRSFDKVLVAVGRKPNTQLLGLDFEHDPSGGIQVDEFLRTNYPNIYAVGDSIGPYQFTHTASHEAWFASVNSLFGKFKKFKVDYRVIPWVTFTDPEVARVGLSEQQAQESNIAYELSRFDLAGQDRAIAENNAFGFVKVLTVPGKDKILGATIVGSHGGEMLTEFVAAMKHGYGLNKILSTIHAYPTLSEANKSVAGVWKQNHKPEKLLAWVEKYHQWQRR